MDEDMTRLMQRKNNASDFAFDITIVIGDLCYVSMV